MSNKLSDKDLALIMSYTDGQIEPSNIAYVEKLINENDEAKKVFEDLSLTSNVYKDYVSSIDDNSQKNTHILLYISLLYQEIKKTVNIVSPYLN